MGTVNVVGVIGDGLGLPLWIRFIGATPLCLLGAAWFFMAATLVFRGDNVEKPNRMAQFYGYSVCLIAIIVGLFTVSSLIGTSFERAHPDAALHAQYNGLVQDRIAHVRYNSSKTLVTSGLLLLIAVVLFGLHWRWLRRTNGAAPA